MFPPDIEVCVIDSYQAARDGLAAALSGAGFHVADPHDPIAWLEASDRHVAVVRVEQDAEWDLIIGLAAAGRVVALLSPPLANGHGSPFRRAIRSGANAAMPTDRGALALGRVICEVADGMAIIPYRAVQSVATAAEDVLDLLASDEREWLRKLASGETVSGLARHVGYSVRQMNRHLKSVYERLGVRTKAEAVARAVAVGLADTP